MAYTDHIHGGIHCEMQVAGSREAVEAFVARVGEHLWTGDRPGGGRLLIPPRVLARQGAPEGVFDAFIVFSARDGAPFERLEDGLGEDDAAVATLGCVDPESRCAEVRVYAAPERMRAPHPGAVPGRLAFARSVAIADLAAPGDTPGARLSPEGELDAAEAVRELGLDAQESALRDLVRGAARGAGGEQTEYLNGLRVIGSRGAIAAFLKKNARRRPWNSPWRGAKTHDPVYWGGRVGEREFWPRRGFKGVLESRMTFTSLGHMPFARLEADLCGDDEVVVLLSSVNRQTLWAEARLYGARGAGVRFQEAFDGLGIEEEEPGEEPEDESLSHRQGGSAAAIKGTDGVGFAEESAMSTRDLDPDTEAELAADNLAFDALMAVESMADVQEEVEVRGLVRAAPRSGRKENLESLDLHRRAREARIKL